MRDPNISWVSMVEKKLGLEMDDSDDDESSDDGIGLALKIMTRHDVINMFSRFSVIVTFIGNLLFLGKKKIESVNLSRFLARCLFSSRSKVKNGFEGKKKAPEKMQFINDNDETKATTPDLEVAEKSLAPAKDGSETPEMKVCFKNLQAFSACFDAFAHGGNDVGLVWVLCNSQIRWDTKAFFQIIWIKGVSVVLTHAMVILRLKICSKHDYNMFNFVYNSIGYSL